MLNEEELNEALNDFIARYNMKAELRSMYAAENREAYATKIIERELTRIVKQRMYLHVPTNLELYDALEHI